MSVIMRMIGCLSRICVLRVPALRLVVRGRIVMVHVRFWFVLMIVVIVMIIIVGCICIRVIMTVVVVLGAVALVMGIVVICIRRIILRVCRFWRLKHKRVGGVILRRLFRVGLGIHDAQGIGQHKPIRRSFARLGWLLRRLTMVF